MRESGSADGYAAGMAGEHGVGAVSIGKNEGGRRLVVVQLRDGGRRRPGWQQLRDMVVPGKVRVTAQEGGAQECRQVLRTNNLKVPLACREVIDLHSVVVFIRRRVGRCVRGLHTFAVETHGAQEPLLSRVTTGKPRGQHQGHGHT